MYGVTTNGFVIKDLDTIRDEIDAYQRANIDAGLDLSDRSVLGQINAIMASKIYETWELAQAVYASQYPDTASGDALDSVCAITGTTRDVVTKARVTGQVTVNPNSPLPAGSVAHLSGQPSARFITLTTVASDPVGGVFDVVFEAESAGQLAVAPNQLTVIAEPVTGWIGVDNALAGTSGEDREPDEELRIKRENELQGSGSTNVDAIRAAILQLTGVLDADVLENDDTATDPTTGAPGKSVFAIVHGGTAADIAKAIFDTKAAGIETWGSTTQAILDSMLNSHDIKFSYATTLSLYCDVTVLVDPNVFDAVNGPSDIEDAIEEYGNSLGIGDDVIHDQVRCAVLDIPGVIKATSLEIGFAASPSGTGDLSVQYDQKVIGDAANVNVTVTP